MEFQNQKLLKNRQLISIFKSIQSYLICLVSRFCIWKYMYPYNVIILRYTQKYEFKIKSKGLPQFDLTQTDTYLFSLFTIFFSENLLTICSIFNLNLENKTIFKITINIFPNNLFLKTNITARHVVQSSIINFC